MQSAKNLKFMALPLLAGIGFGAAAIILGIYFFMNPNPKGTHFKITLHGFFKEEIAPENISTIALYHINYNLWDTLLTSDRNPSIATLDQVSKDYKTYTFSISETARFSNGRKVEAADVKFSIDRAISKAKNGHANAKGLVNEVRIQSPSKIEIELKAPTPSFLFLLSTPEFAVIPREICNEETLDIKDLSVTSGAYSVTQIDPEKKLIHLKKNPLFPRHEESSPETVEISFSIANGENPPLVRDTESHFMEISSSNADQVVKDLKNSPGRLKFSVTRPSLSTFFIRNPKGISEEKSKAFLALMREHFSFDTEVEKKSVQYLPPRTFGSLDQSELPDLSSSTKVDTITVKVANPETPLMQALRQAADRAKVDLKIVNMDFKGEADYQGSAQGMNADFPEVEIYLAMLSPYAFIPAREGIKTAVEKAFHETDAGKRSQLIKEAGRKLLESGTILPMTVRSYLHVYDSTRVDASKITTYDGDIPLWKVRML